MGMQTRTFNSGQGIALATIAGVAMWAGIVGAVLAVIA